MNSQVRYNGDVYDILGDVKLGQYQYLIIGVGSDTKFFDIAFIEKRLENDKVRYIYPNINYNFSEGMDFVHIQGQRLMDYIINEIKDKINMGELATKEVTVQKINGVIEQLETNQDIKGVFETPRMFSSEGEFEDSIKTLINYYTSKNKKAENASFEEESVLVSPETSVEKVYEDLEKTQNFGVSGIFGLAKNNDDYVVDPTNHIFEEKKNDDENIITDSLEDTKIETTPVIERTLPNLDEHLSVEDIRFLLEKKGDKMTLQQKLYWENELATRVPLNPETTQENMAKGNARVLSNGKSLLDNAAYVSISVLLYLIGSFELLLTIIMLARFL